MTGLATTIAGLELQNPIVLAAGTAAYGAELDRVMAVERLGAITTKAVSLEPRSGAAAPRVAEFAGGMINAVGLANPGVEAVSRDHLPWLARLVRARVIVNVVGFATHEFAEVVARLDGEPGVHAFELNVSCPNVKAGGLEFGADPGALRDLVTRVRAATARPVLVKLSPTLPQIDAVAKLALDSGADGLTLVNTLPGLVIDVSRRTPVLGFGTGGVSGAGLLPVGVLATWRVYSATKAPIVGIGGVATAEHALQYLLAGASAVGVGTAALQNPRVPERLVGELERWCAAQGVRAIADLRGALQWPT